MTTLWQTRLASLTSQIANGGASAFRYFSQPTAFLRLKQVLCLLLCLWIVGSLWTGLWSFLPEAQPLPEIEVINPVSSGSAVQVRNSVDIEALVAARLFGEPGSAVSAETLAAATGRAPAMSEAEASIALAGIEDGAPDTRLPLLLRGVLAASEAGLGQAVVEHRKLQDLYQVGDELPVSGEVVLAKVLSNLVVLDNGGRYEVLRLFEEVELMTSVSDSTPNVSVAERSRATDAPVRNVEVDTSASEIATEYRERLYRDPQSLAEVVRVVAVRDGDQLQGYRVSPGSAAGEFTALGFETGDLVTAVNGMSLTDPANTVRLYQAMRSASEASFELQRKGESVTLNVSLGAPAGKGES
ncbi:type II secretion system protein GspC [Congregibacter brevis]|uniref:Type II secretion system protein GspC n=1 Tax=Congregibacter brevis TaxID=3081201 RepID=A0ABZ0IIA7_9GAMM|nr:type II secretion system protein GspC [Congregibacter sp. IMCC45268]